MINTVNNILFSQIFYCFVNGGLMTIRYNTCHPLCSQYFEFLLDFAEYKLNWIVVRLVGHVIYVPES